MATQANTPGSPELSVVPADVEAPSSARPLPFLYLEIRRGKTGFPQRPVYSRNFLIGSGAGCDLRLGGEGIPEVHSVLVVTDEEVRVQWLAEAPPLTVNGAATHEAALTDGDQIGIGRFEFTVHRFAEQIADPPQDTQNTSKKSTETASLLNLLREAKDSAEEDDLTKLSAGELVAKIEAGEELVAEFEDAIRQGEEALLYAAAQRAADLRDDSPESTDSPSSQPAAADPIEAEVLEELEKVIQQLSGVSAELDERALRLANQEATQAEAAELLLEAQKELAAQLERFHRQVAETQQETEPKLRKAA